MINNELLNYIRKEIAKGTSTESIKTALRSGGWNEVDFLEAFNAIGPTTPLSVPKAPTPPIAPVAKVVPVIPLASSPSMVAPSFVPPITSSSPLSSPSPETNPAFNLIHNFETISARNSIPQTPQATPNLGSLPTMSNFPQTAPILQNMPPRSSFSQTAPIHKSKFKKMLTVFLVFVLLGAAGAGAYIKFIKPKINLPDDTNIVGIPVEDTIDEADLNEPSPVIATHTYANHGFSIELPEGYIPHEEQAEGGPSLSIALPDGHLSYWTDASWWEKYSLPEYAYVKDEKIGATTFKVYTFSGQTFYWFMQGNVGYEFSGDKKLLETFKPAALPQVVGNTVSVHNDWKTFSDHGISISTPSNFELTTHSIANGDFIFFVESPVSEGIKIIKYLTQDAYSKVASFDYNSEKDKVTTTLVDENYSINGSSAKLYIQKSGNISNNIILVPSKLIVIAIIPDKMSWKGNTVTDIETMIKSIKLQ